MRRRGARRVGAHMAHFERNGIVLGGLCSQLLRFQEFGVFLKDRLIIPRGNFDLKVDKFWIVTHERSGQVVQ